MSYLEMRETMLNILKFFFTFFCMFMPSTSGIGVDYYYEYDTRKQYNNFSYLKVNDSVSLNGENNKSVDENDKEGGLEVNDISVTVKAIQDNVKNVEVAKDKKDFYNSQKSDYRKFFKSSLSNATDYLNLTSSLHIFKEYEYNYDDGDINDMGYKTANLEQKRRNYLISKEKKKKQKPDIKKLSLFDYYTLEPAAAYVNPQGGIFLSEEDDVWYVPEELPCWQLPLLFAEFENRRKTPDVFSIYRGNLNNVVRQTSKKRTFSKVTHNIESQMFNKWCEIEPCYGDHTLCLFPDKTISSFCEKDYQVKTPTMSEQVALVNTINSMRNRVAIGDSLRYSHLPTAANMMQITYDFDLEKMAHAWLSQCLPGPAPCSALDGNFVSQLECKKYLQRCCTNSITENFNCTPPPECFVPPVVGCMHKWYWSAGESISETDIQCGHIEASTYNTVQLIWASTYKIGCAYGVSRNGDIRVVCDFSPGAPFFLKRKFYCGLLPYKDITKGVDKNVDITNLTFLSSIGINLDEVQESNGIYVNNKLQSKNHTLLNEDHTRALPHWGVESLSKIYPEGWARSFIGKTDNGTMGMLARVVTQYTFYEESQARCDTEEPIYVEGKPGSMCIEGGRRYPALCYHYGDPTPGFRLVAIIAPVALFSLVLYDLFSSAVRQTI